MSGNITLRQIECFLAVASEKHFTRAAAGLHVSAPHLSQTINKLERLLGVQLLSRTTRSVELTDAGEVLHQLSRRALADLTVAISMTKRSDAPERRDLKLGYTIGAGLDVVPDLLRTFAARNTPGETNARHITTIEYDYADPTAGLRDRTVDAAVVRPPIGLTGLATVHLATEPRMACLPTRHPLAKKDVLLVADLLDEPIIAAPDTPGPWRDYWILSDYRNTPAHVVAEAATVEAELHLVARGAGISITAQSMSTYYPRPGVTFTVISDLEPCRVTLAWWPQDSRLVAELASIAEQFADSGRR